MTYGMLRLNAMNDTNGNPRRCYVLLRIVRGSTDIAGVWDEGYEGGGAVPKRWRRLVAGAPVFYTTPTEYRDTLRHGAALRAQDGGA